MGEHWRIPEGTYYDFRQTCYDSDCRLVPLYEGEKRVKGIEPSCAAWEAAVLPLNYTRVCEK
jgi:hypothetical protein